MSKFIERETGYKYTLQQNSVYEGTITTLLKHQTIYMYGTYCDSGIVYYEVIGDTFYQMLEHIDALISDNVITLINTFKLCTFIITCFTLFYYMIRMNNE